MRENQSAEEWSQHMFKYKFTLRTKQSFELETKNHIHISLY